MHTAHPWTRQIETTGHDGLRKNIVLFTSFLNLLKRASTWANSLKAIHSFKSRTKRFTLLFKTVLMVLTIWRWSATCIALVPEKEPSASTSKSLFLDNGSSLIRAKQSSQSWYVDGAAVVGLSRSSIISESYREVQGSSRGASCSFLWDVHQKSVRHRQ